MQYGRLLFLRSWHGLSSLLVRLGIASAAPLSGQEVSAALGRLRTTESRQATYSWQIQYLERLSSSWGASLTWLNEGHIPNHHRDGAALQGWFIHQKPREDMWIGAGFGVLRYFDTTGEDQGAEYENRHGFKPILSLRIQHALPDPMWAAFIQVNRTVGGESPGTRSLMLGLSRRFGPSNAVPGPDLTTSSTGTEERPHNEVTILMGRTIVNSFQSETTGFPESFALEYRRHLSPHLDATLSYCAEGDVQSAQRDGLAAQVWVSTRTSPDRWRLSFGLGPYFARVAPDEGSTSFRAIGRYSLMLGKDFGSHWGARLQWHRTLTRNDRDTDALLLGLAYLW